MASVLVTLSIAAFMLLLALVCIALSFGTDAWVDVSVNRNALKTTGLTSASLNTSLYQDPSFFSRGRGLFRTCFPGSETLFLESAQYRGDVVDSQCLNEVGLSPDERATMYGDDYTVRSHLLRAHLAFFAISLLLILVSLGFAIFSCLNTKIRVISFGSIFAMVSALFTAGGMGTFHYYRFLETDRLTHVDLRYYGYWMKDTAANFPNLQMNATENLGYSYILGWVGFGLSFLGAIFYFAAAYTKSVRDRPPKPPRKSKAKAKGGAERKPRQHKMRNPGYGRQDYTQPPAADYPGYGTGAAQPGYGAYPYGYDYPQYDASYRY